MCVAQNPYPRLVETVAPFTVLWIWCRVQLITFLKRIRQDLFKVWHALPLHVSLNTIKEPHYWYYKMIHMSCCWEKHTSKPCNLPYTSIYLVSSICLNVVMIIMFLASYNPLWFCARSHCLVSWLEAMPQHICSHLVKAIVCVLLQSSGSEGKLHSGGICIGCSVPWLETFPKGTLCCRLILVSYCKLLYKG